MWVAACPRCGFAVRWNPRGARGPLRVWNRLRALNNRFGVALGAAQVAGVLWAVIGGVLADTLPAGLRAALAGNPRFISGGPAAFIVLATACATLAAVSTVAIAPHRGILARWVAAWTLGVLPVTIALVALPVTFDQRETIEKVRAILHPDARAAVLIACALPIAASLPLAMLLEGPRRLIARWLARRHRRLVSLVHATS